MKIVDIVNLQREEGHIFYLRKYEGEAVLELPTSVERAKISFSIEMSPFGEKTVDLSLLSSVNYPLLPVKKALIEYIILSDSKGTLPC
ncbi:MAG: hypothetical protein E7060_05320 [Treponema bryantii]|nr:hypothetical protein [Treponema bryantii]MBQ7969538.1 hypothetical protein [Treponema sp.]